MPPAPRQGRKGGKISTSPAVGSDNASPATVSPGTVLPSAADFGGDLEFNIEALMESKRGRSKAGVAKDPADVAAKSNEASTAAAAEASSADASAGVGGGSLADANVFKFDLDALEQIGQGVVIGGNKNVRTDTRKPEASSDAVRQRLQQLLRGQEVLPGRVKQPAAASDVERALEAPVVIVKRAHDALALAAAVSRAEPATAGGAVPMVLVVVPKFFEVAHVADGLAAITGGAVGELCGQSFRGPESCRLWVAAAETALTHLRAQKSLAPFTHLVVPGLRRMTPLVAYFLWGLRERVFRQSANLDPNAPPLHIVVCANEGNHARIEAFFAEQKPITLTPTFAEDVVEFSYDEANALVGMDVLEVDVDATGKFPGPHRKLVDHTAKLAVSITRTIVAAATTPQCIYITTADFRDTMEALRTASLPNTKIFSGRSVTDAIDGEAAAAGSASHRVFVMPTVLHFADPQDHVIHFVLDLGTVRRLSQQTKSESFMTGNSSEWACAREVQEHKDLLTGLCPTGYFALYPPAAAEVFLANDRSPALQRSPIFDTEDALLQCSRAEVPVPLCHDVLTPTDPDTLEQVVFNLAEKCLLASPQDLSLTFLGEVTARLPLEIDLAHYVINGSAMGLGEATVAIASVCSLPFYRLAGTSGASASASQESILSSRAKYAGEVARQSDLLADTLVFLEWRERKAQGQPTADLVAELQACEQQLERVEALMDHLRSQLSDYVFIDEFSDVDVLQGIRRSIRANPTTFIFLQAVSFARRSAFVRDAGKLNPRDRAAALTFVRTSKKVTLSSFPPSSVPWQLGDALIAVDLRNFTSSVGCSRISAVGTSYFFSSLLLLYPQVEYSEPAEGAGGRGRVVYMSVTCNRQMKRFRVSIEEAAAILDFREKWNRALGYLQALRTRRRPISRRRFELELKQKDRFFDLTQFQAQLQSEFVRLVTDVEVTEHQGSFTTYAVHCLSPSCDLPPAEGCEASDVVVTKLFHDGELWRFTAHSPSPAHIATPATMDSAAVAAMTFPTQHAAFDDDDEDEIEFIAESYFIKHGPIIEDEDDD